jgi:hypothetical protein
MVTDNQKVFVLLRCDTENTLLIQDVVENQLYRS